MTDEQQETDTLIKFPCEFPIKAMGITTDGLDAIVVEIVRRHVEDVAEGAVSTRQSSGGKYTSVTVVVHATSKPQIDAIYQDLSSHELIKYVL